MSKKAVILYSGGLDSTTCMAIARAEGFAPYAISFAYGQRHAVELELARINARSFGAVDHLVVDFDYRIAIDRIAARGKLPAAEITAIAGRAALAGPLSARLRSEWSQWKKAREADDKAAREKHGRDPDFGDPAAALADIDGKVSALENVSLTVEPGTTVAFVAMHVARRGRMAPESVARRMVRLAALAAALRGRYAHTPKPSELCRACGGTAGAQAAAAR